MTMYIIWHHMAFNNPLLPSHPNCVASQTMQAFLNKVAGSNAGKIAANDVKKLVTMAPKMAPLGIAAALFGAWMIKPAVMG